MFSLVVICLLVVIKRTVYAQGSISDIDSELGLDGGKEARELYCYTYYRYGVIHL